MISKLVSVIIPVYKVEPFLKRCVNSVLVQTYSNLEIILVDDGSPDNCPKICDEYAKTNSRIKVIHKENGGLSDARNAGLNICSGDYIFFLDSDDWISRNSIQTLLKIAEKKDFDIVVGNFRKVFSNQNPTNPQTTSHYRSMTPSQAIQCLGGPLDLTFTVAWGKLYKRYLWTEIRFPKGKLYEDAYICHLLYAKSKEVAFIDSPLYNYLQRKDSIMGKTVDYLHALEPRLHLDQFLKDNYPNLRYVSLSKLCWDYLFAYSQNTAKKEHLEKFYSYYREYKNVPRPTSIQSLSLHFFATFPKLYVFYQNKSPFRLRKK